MARPTEWRRWNNPFFDGGTAEIEHQAQIGILSAGETLTRVRWMWSAQSVVTFPSLATGAPIGVGIVVLPSQDPDPGDVPHPYSDPTADWLYLEDEFFYPYTVTFGSGTPNELDMAPGYKAQRDAKAMRRAEVNSSIWICSQIAPAVESQAPHFFSAAGSTLVTLA